MRKIKGFTLIELLVVIGIIGILATIVIASLGRSRTAAKDAAVAQSLNNYRTQIEIDFEGNYNGLCTSGNPSLGRIEAYIESQGGEMFGCNSNARDYVITAVLPSGREAFLGELINTQYAFAQEDIKSNGFCINSRGSSVKISLDEFKLLPKEIPVSKTEGVASIETMLNPFCTVNEIVSFQSGGQENSQYKRVCYDLTQPEYTSSGCINVITDEPVDPGYCDDAGIESLGCEGDFDPLRYENRCISTNTQTGCVEVNENGGIIQSVDKVFCKDSEPVSCEDIFAAQCIDATYPTGCVEIDKDGNVIAPVDKEKCDDQKITPSTEQCKIAAVGVAAQCIDATYPTGCVEIDKDGNVIAPVDNGKCDDQKITPSKENCLVPGNYVNVCIKNDPPYQTGCVEDRDDKLFQVDVNFCKELPTAICDEVLTKEVFDQYAKSCSLTEAQIATGLASKWIDKKWIDSYGQTCEKQNFEKSQGNCTLTDAQIATGLANKWIGQEGIAAYKKTCDEQALQDFETHFNSCSLTEAQIATGLANKWIDEKEVIEYKSDCELEAHKLFESNAKACIATEADYINAVTNGWVQNAEVDAYKSDCEALARTEFDDKFNSCDLTEAELSIGVGNEWIKEFEIETYNKNCK